MSSGHGQAAAERWLHAVPDRDTEDVWPLLDAPIAFDRGSASMLSPQVAYDLERHVEAYGPRRLATGSYGAWLVDALGEAALRGRGGAHFPVVRKWRAAIAAGGGGLVVANCAEGEPASAKDAALLQLRPHLVLDGLALAAETTGTREAVVWLHQGDRATRLAVVRAIEERRLAGDLDLVVRIVDSPDHYLSGESSAVVRALSGGPALPHLARRPAAVAGVSGRPTLLHNAETLARVALIARQGGAARGAGPLITVVGRSTRVVVPTGAGETFAEAVHRSGTAVATPQAALVGGYGGSWLPWADISGLAVDGTGLDRWTTTIGAGVVAPLESAACGLAETARILAYLAASSARQCGPCFFGLPAMHDVFRRLAEGDGSRRGLKTLQRYAGEISGRGACHHPDGAVRLVDTAMRTFHADVRRHVEHGPCAGASSAGLLPVPVLP